MAGDTKSLVQHLRTALIAGKYKESQYLPSVRELCDEFGVSFETARRGLKVLEHEGLLTSEARQGFRVATQSTVISARSPVAYISSHFADLRNAQPANWAINQALTLVAAQRGKPTLGVHVQGLAPDEILARLNAAQLSGLVLDTLDEGLLRLLSATPLPLVMVNSWFEDAPVNVVLQDNYRGGYLAARWLMEAGAKRVAWLGPAGEFCHTRERFGGVVAGLAVSHRRIADGLIVPGDEGEAHALLARPDRPDAVVAFTRSAARALRQAADALRLTAGKDFLAIGWTVDDFYDSEHRAVWAGGPVPPAVVWSAREMAEAAMDLLAAPRPEEARYRRVLVPTRVRTS
ncbi:MAG: GntR family transcriptional regulator [Planctomycetota bacterium]|nr:GntR family transcriptional regulator [Planctomycetota bacterium]